MVFEYREIGTIRSENFEPAGTPIQPAAASGIKGKIEVFEEFSDGLKDLEGFSHIILLYHFHLSKKFSLSVKPFMDDEPHGVFATRTPSRPNPIGISIVKLKGINGKILDVEDIDVIDGTPLLDIKPYVTEFDCVHGVKTGWLENNLRKLKKSRDDGRFAR